MYWPPITIRCVDCRQFGREVLVGTSVITNPTDYIWVSPEELARRAEEKRRLKEELAKAKAGEDGNEGPGEGGMGTEIQANGDILVTIPEENALYIPKSGRATPVGSLHGSKGKFE